MYHNKNSIRWGRGVNGEAHGSEGYVGLEIIHYELVWGGGRAE